MRTRVKICCIASVQEARRAVAAGADALGLVSKMPGPGTIADETAAEVAAGVPPPVAPWLLTLRGEPEDIAAHVEATGVQTVQLVRHVEPGVHEALRRLSPRLRIVQVVHVEDETAIETARAYAASADALLLDSGKPSAAEPMYGGTGATHDWAISRRIVEAVDRPVFLAGGLRPSNVAQAIRLVRPFGVDLCNGVRIEGRLDPTKLADFMAAVRAA